MKCPKCHYLSFDPEPRCRNCGYTLALGDGDLPVASVEPVAQGALADLTLRLGGTRVTGDGQGETHRAAVGVRPDPVESAAPAPKRRRRAAARGPFDAPDPTVDVPRLVMETDDAAALPEAPAVAADMPMALRPDDQSIRPVTLARAVPAPHTTELPLFLKAMPQLEAEDADLFVRPDASTELARDDMWQDRPKGDRPLRARAIPSAGAAPRKLGPLDHDLLEDLARIEDNDRREALDEARALRRGSAAGMASRLGAAAVDAALLMALFVAVVWATLRWCGVPIEEVQVLPIAPTLAFLLVLGLGYLLLFTAAGGQTLGKMVCGIRVVDESEGTVLPVRQAMYRELVALPSILALGLGFLPALVGDERALHDRLAHTKVVRT